VDYRLMYDDDTRQVADTLRNRLESFTEEECLAHLQTMACKWKIENPPVTLHDFINMGLVNFESTANPAESGVNGMNHLIKMIHMAELEALALCSRMKELDLLVDREEGKTMLKILRVIYYSRKVSTGLFLGAITYHEEIVLDEQIEENILGSWNLRFRWGCEKLKDFQKLLLFLLDICMENRYRKQGDSLFEPLVIDGRRTYAWKRIGTIKNFIFEQCRKESEFDAFLQLTSSNRIWKQMEEHLQACADHQLPNLVKNRHFFSFRNGIYSAMDDRFYTYNEAYSMISDTIVSSKYFDVDIQLDINECDWGDIQTPVLDSVMTYQGFEGPTLQWFYIMIGRMLYSVSEMDNWQVFPYLLGLAGTGKSTIIHDVVAKLYSPEDVGILSNNTEKTFGLAAIYDKLLFVAGEVKRDLALEQSEFQSLVSGESMAINEKYKTAFAVHWTVPGMMAGNELPSFSDNAGSIARRLIVFRFDKKVQRGDTKLGQKIATEMGRILIKANKTYLEAARSFGTRDVWDMVPRQFIESRDRSMASLSLLDSYMRQACIKIGPDFYMTKNAFLSSVRAFASESGFDGPKPSQENLLNSLGKFGVSLQRGTKRVRGRDVVDDFLIGMDIDEDDKAF